MEDFSLRKRIRDACLLEGQFVLRSGQVSTTYFDKYRFETNPTLLGSVAREMIKRLPAETEVLAGLELGGIPIATAMSLSTGLPVVFVRKEAKEYGTCRAVEGLSVDAKRVVIIEDVITTGGAVVDAVRLLGDEGADIIAALCVIWRGEGDVGIRSLPDLSVAAAFTGHEILHP